MAGEHKGVEIGSAFKPSECLRVGAFLVAFHPDRFRIGKPEEDSSFLPLLYEVNGLENGLLFRTPWMHSGFGVQEKAFEKNGRMGLPKHTLQLSFQGKDKGPDGKTVNDIPAFNIAMSQLQLNIIKSAIKQKWLGPDVSEQQYYSTFKPLLRPSTGQFPDSLYIKLAERLGRVLAQVWLANGKETSFKAADIFDTFVRADFVVEGIYFNDKGWGLSAKVTGVCLCPPEYSPPKLVKEKASPFGVIVSPAAGAQHAA